MRGIERDASRQREMVGGMNEGRLATVLEKENKKEARPTRRVQICSQDFLSEQKR